MIVEDSAAIRILLAQVLLNGGHDPIEASTGEEAIKVVMSDAPDLAVIDHHLPGLTGVEVIRTIRHSSMTRLRGLPIVGISGVPGTEQALLKAGADAFVRKPFREVDLLEAMAQARRSRSAAKPT